MLAKFTLAALALAASFTTAAVMPAMSMDSRVLARRSLSGQATFYGGNVAGGTCSFSTYTLPSGLQGTALSDSNWDDAANCGGCVTVSYGGNSVTAMIVDQCPGCGLNHLDLFPAAFDALAPASKGIIDVTWNYVPCPVTGPLSIHMKGGVSQFFFSAQVVNAKRRTATLEASADQGKTWQVAERQTYNFFQIARGLGTTSAWIRVTSETGTQVVVQDVKIEGDFVKVAASNYA